MNNTSEVQVVKPPCYKCITKALEGIPIFLAGSIEMGKAEDWQARFERRMRDEIAGTGSDFPVILLNPRRDNWDSSWKQSKDNVQFYEQVTWELTAMEESQIIAMYFDPDTISPVTLFELGLHMKKNKTVVCCPPGYHRKGNVDITAQFYGVPVFDSWEPWFKEIVRRIHCGAEIWS